MALRELNFELTFDSQIRKIKDANTAFDKMKSESLSAGRNINTLDQNSGRLGRTLKGVGVLAAGLFAGLTAKAGFDFFIKGNADMETYRNTLAVVMKDADKANEALNWATKFAATTPFEVPGIVEATTRLATYGMEAQSTLPIIGDMAATMGKDIMQAVEAVADALRKVWASLNRVKSVNTKSLLIFA